ncbi:hypothetical protein CYLTODRAFT_183808 [Cylindrobasidium torrendii FP15055 ss-10]|uniref:Uncharacterized protein n=1 Tax=Cylindrobasidium torrendii FP15055 ss-10 TaxID=1314674 RepID=A0A0D7BLB7_9AGAR|nr:hypothetical protein CYLTODRAFT_183808 [Cylindrobasidium torrendii FP15055 ss-10]
MATPQSHERLSTMLSESYREIDSLRSALQNSHTSAELHTRIARLEADLARAQRERDIARQERDDARIERDSVRAGKTERERDDARRERDDARHKLDALRGMWEHLKREMDVATGAALPPPHSQHPSHHRKRDRERDIMPIPQHMLPDPPALQPKQKKAKYTYDAAGNQYPAFNSSARPLHSSSSHAPTPPQAVVMHNQLGGKSPAMLRKSPPEPREPYPARNELGQRICRNCGQAGRYKEDKCIEKWGPGPLGPGTVCDRCRKKTKRIERSNTVASPNSHPSSSPHLPPPMRHTPSMDSMVGQDADAEIDADADLEIDELDEGETRWNDRDADADDGDEVDDLLDDAIDAAERAHR